MKPWGFVILFVLYFLAVAASWRYAEEGQIALTAAWTAALVAAVGIVIQFHFAHQQTDLMRQTTVLTERQTELGEYQAAMQDTLRRLTTIPVLAPNARGDAVVEVFNCGSGPAMDVRAIVCRPRPSDPRVTPIARFSTQLSRSHLGPNDDALEIHSLPGDVQDETTGRRTSSHSLASDVWIVHCGDLNGWHWHAWNNWSRDNQHSTGEPFIFESEEKTPAWIRRYCPRCKEIDELRRREESET